MAVKILEIHHTGVRIDNDAKLLNATKDFYANVFEFSAERTGVGVAGKTISARARVALARVRVRGAVRS